MDLLYVEPQHIAFTNLNHRHGRLNGYWNFYYHASLLLNWGLWRKEAAFTFPSCVLFYSFISRLFVITGRPFQSNWTLFITRQGALEWIDVSCCSPSPPIRPSNNWIPNVYFWLFQWNFFRHWKTIWPCCNLLLYSRLFCSIQTKVDFAFYN